MHHYCLELVHQLQAAAAVAEILVCLTWWLLVGCQQVKHQEALLGSSGSTKDNVEMNVHTPALSSFTFVPSASDAAECNLKPCGHGVALKS